MKLIEVNEKELERIKKEKNEELKFLLLDFMADGHKCVQVIDNNGYYNNENDLYSSIRSKIKRTETLKDKVKVFMLNGNVYLKRKDK